MLIILLLFSLFRTLQGIPLSSTIELHDGFFALDPRDSQSHVSQRSINDIVVSCFATIFACTWTAIHPNIPALTDCWWSRFKRQVTTLICALLAPELITIWALRQRLDAKIIMDEYNEAILGDHNVAGPEASVLNTIRRLFHDAPLASASSNASRWTLAHGFFLQMGGFMLSENGRPTQILLHGRSNTETKRMIYNIQQGIIDPPKITEEEIQDRSKGDVISKTLIVIQTAWFIVQCIARWARHLPVTELEIVTLGFALLNGITYALWWHKPQNVGRSVFLERKKPRDTTPGDASEEARDSITPHTENSETEKRSKVAFTGNDDDGVLPDSNQGQVRESWYQREILRDAIASIREAPWAIIFLIPLLPIIISYHLLILVIHPLFKLFPSDMPFNIHPDLHITHRVPMFYTPGREEVMCLGFIPVIGALFGAVHLAPAWFLDYSSPQEMWLWRSSALIITIEPILFGLALCLAYWDQDFLANALSIFSVLSFAIYPVARILLLVISLTSLRTLPPGALQTIEWTTFIPHL